jgi:hypothetical protein
MVGGRSLAQIHLRSESWMISGVSSAILGSGYHLQNKAEGQEQDIKDLVGKGLLINIEILYR